MIINIICNDIRKIINNISIITIIISNVIVYNIFISIIIYNY